MSLTDAKLRNLKKPGKHFDGGGLYLELTKAGGRYWRLKYRFQRKEKRLALGVYPAVSLKEARQKATEARQLLADGVDPSAKRRADKLQAEHETANTLQAVAVEWMQHQAARWTPQTATRVARSLELHVFPKLGAMPLAQITPQQLRQVVQDVEATGAGTMADRVLQRVKSVFRWAAVNERIQTNPMADLVPADILPAREVRHRPALPDSELPEFLARLDQYQGDRIVVLALQFLILTATRPGETRGARWAEFDLPAAMWSIPAERMKMHTPHKVPLSRQALALLDEAAAFSGGRGLVFPSPSYPSRPISENTFNSVLSRLGYKGRATAHGFRALFSTVANEQGWRADAIERQLAHVERNKVRAAYHRSTHTAERVRLLQWWADYIDSKRPGANVVPMPARSA